MTQLCPKCDGTGYVHIAKEGKRYTVPCGCRAKRQLEDARHRPGGFESISDIVARQPDLNDLLPLDTKIVGALIGKHQGHKNAITIREIGEELWAEEWRKGGHPEPTPGPLLARVLLAKIVPGGISGMAGFATVGAAGHYNGEHLPISIKGVSELSSSPPVYPTR